MQNVVTYQTVINVPNAQLKLKPGMTANVNIEIARKTNVLRIPAAATAIPADHRDLRGAQTGSRLRTSARGGFGGGRNAGGGAVGNGAPGGGQPAGSTVGGRGRQLPRQTRRPQRLHRSRPMPRRKASASVSARAPPRRPRRWRRTANPGRNSRRRRCGGRARRRTRRIRSEHDARRASQADGRADGGDDA